MDRNAVNKKRKFIADGVMVRACVCARAVAWSLTHSLTHSPPQNARGTQYAELHSLLLKEFREDGYAGVEVRVTPARTEIIIRTNRTKQVLGDKGRRIREMVRVFFLELSRLVVMSRWSAWR